MALHNTCVHNTYRLVSVCQNIKELKLQGKFSTLHVCTQHIQTGLCMPEYQRTQLQSKFSTNECSFIVVFIAPAYSKVRYRGSTFRPFVRPSVRPSTIYVKVLTL